MLLADAAAGQSESDVTLGSGSSSSAPELLPSSAATPRPSTKLSTLAFLRDSCECTQRRTMRRSRGSN
eukprot:gene3189-biopygen12714